MFSPWHAIKAFSPWHAIKASSRSAEVTTTTTTPRFAASRKPSMPTFCYSVKLSTSRRRSPHASAAGGSQVADDVDQGNQDCRGEDSVPAGGYIARDCGGCRQPQVTQAKSASSAGAGGYGDNLNPAEAAEAEDIIFGSISAHDVRQPVRRTYDNAGEVLPSGVTLRLATVGALGEAIGFLDVGAGVGNVLAQVALTTKVRTCIGIELRRDLISLG
ncbi:uncharacterized protein PITG_08077 [Phytophthora infestans T30-4]|uniref:DOT1 domain-containing protein n=1 Tax=Phytophthora infestans (strain T30-4) TaxID=403677 RepID=D0N9E6_PHYIT|nr:uncharacterized protein PITG_08077 [Phytophthora infestans T30-4]EEY54434.1 conserved hypothetical protein [Phytophthora infestans T30-4]|eukprot:XP_002904256.1 conserved hypothetical protein [Phytophthora infestans T30-4]